MIRTDAVRVKRQARKALGDLERIAGEVTHAGGEQAEAVATSLRNAVSLARDRLVDLEESSVVRMRRAGRHARTYARIHPWTTGGIALAAAAIIAVGVLAQRRRR